MYAPLTAFEVLLGCIVVGFIGAIFGWAGGCGGTLLLRIRIARAEAAVASVVNSAKGSNGQAVAQAQRERVSKADQEAARLAQALARGGRSRGPPQLVGTMSEQDQEEYALAQLEAEAKAKGMVMKK